MKKISFLILILIFASGIFLSCYDEGANPGVTQNSVTDSNQTGDDNTTAQESPLPGERTQLLEATDENTGENYEYTWNDNIKIPSLYNGETINIFANVYIPDAKTEGQKFPLIVMTNSWALEEHEYVAPAMHFAKKGYVVLCYTHRGWWGRPGVASLSGPWDWADFSNVLDWAIANLPVDPKNIGVSGISLGGGASLHQLSHDSRVKTCAALSPYVDMYRSMYSEQTPRLFWGIVLCGTASILANADPNIFKVWNATLKHINLDWLREFMSGKSPVDYIGEVNRMNKPVYIASNFEDHMFQPDVNIDYFNALTVSHKRLDLSVGTHITGEMMGLIGLENYVYANVDKWFDYWLKGIDTGIVPSGDKSAVVTMEEKNNMVRAVYDIDDLQLVNGIYTWPAKSITTETYYCEPKGTVENGRLSSAPGTIKGMNTIYSSFLVNVIDFITQQTQSGCMVAPMLEQFRIPVICNLSALSRETTIIYEAPVLTSVKKIRGAGSATLRMSLSRSNGQVVMYLYDVNENGYGTFITHGFRTWWDAEPGKVMNETIPLVATAYDIPAGHHIALVIDTGDFNYARCDWLPFLLTLHHGDYGQSTLTLSYEQ